MAKFIFTLLIISLSSSVGITTVCGFLLFKLHQVDPDRKWVPLGIMLIGKALTNAVLLYAVGISGRAVPDWRAWTYLVGLLAVGVGLAWLTVELIKELALKEALKDGHLETP